MGVSINTTVTGTPLDSNTPSSTSRITSTGDTLVYPGPAKLAYLIAGSGTGVVVLVKDNGTQITSAIPLTLGTLVLLNQKITNNLTINVSGVSPDITVGYIGY